MVMDVTAFIGQFGFLNFVFSFLLVFALLYALFSKTRIPSDKSDLNALIAFVLAFLVAISPGFSGFLLAFVPYAAAIFVIIALGFVIFGFFGAKPEQAMKVSAFIYGIIILLGIGAFAILGTVWVQVSPVASNTTTNATPFSCTNYTNLVGFAAVQCMLGDPLFLGMIVVFIIMAVAVYMLVAPPKK